MADLIPDLLSSNGTFGSQSRENLLKKVEKLQHLNSQLTASQESNRRQIRLHKLAIENERSLTTFTTYRNLDAIECNFNLLSNHEIEETVIKINALIRRFLGAQQLLYREVQFASLLQGHTISDELSNTWSSYLRKQLLSSRKSVKQYLKGTTATSHDIFKALIWTALRDWVFNSDVFSLEGLAEPFWLQLSHCVLSRGECLLKYIVQC